MWKQHSHLLVLVSMMVFGCADRTGGPDAGPASLSGPYLGQPPPGSSPEVFAPGVVNRGYYTRDIAIAPDGKEIYFGVQFGSFQLAAILVTREVETGWTTPEVANFSRDSRWSTLEPSFAPDGDSLFFSSNRPEGQDGDAEGHFSLWTMDRLDDSWSEPRRLPKIINDGSSNFFPSITREKTLYFTRDLPDGSSAIFRSRLDGTDYLPPEKLPDTVNAGRSQFNALVAPDESFLIVPIFGLPNSRGATDYYIVFRGEDDSWSQLINLGDQVNSKSGTEYSPSLSPDGRYLFFMSGRDRITEIVGPTLTAEGLHRLHNSPGNGLPVIWWVDAGFLESLKP